MIPGNPYHGESQRQTLSMTPTSSFIRFLRQLYRAILLPAFALALLGIMWAAVIYQVGQEKDSAHFEAVLHSQSLAHTLAEHTNHLLRQTDHATQLFKLKFEETNGTLRLPEFTRKGGLLDSLLPSKLDLPLALLGPDGRVIDSIINGYFAPNLADQGFFRAHASTHEDTPMVATPRGRGTHQEMADPAVSPLERPSWQFCRRGADHDRPRPTSWKTTTA